MKRTLQSCLVAIAICVCFLSMSGNTFAQDGSPVQKAAQCAIFIYDSSTTPCAPAPPGATLIPLGSGFIVGLARKEVKPENNEKLMIYKFLVTAQHVISNRDSVIVRLNRTDIAEFACFPIKLVRNGKNRNVFTLPKHPEVDLIAVSIPDFPNTNPVIFDYSLILDDELMRKWDITVGTDVFTVGYLYGYSGEKQNFPVTKFGKVALLTDEAWYKSPQPRNFEEKAYLVEMQNVPGLSGAPIILQSPQYRIDQDDKFQYRKMPPAIIGVIKGALASPAGGSQGVAAIEPGSHLKEILKSIADELKAAGVEVQLE
jgi:hypothetical protein